MRIEYIKRHGMMEPGQQVETGRGVAEILIRRGIAKRVEDRERLNLGTVSKKKRRGRRRKTNAND